MEGNRHEFHRLQVRYRASQEDLKREKERSAQVAESYEREIEDLRRELRGSRSGSSLGSRK
jgi:hypothetical protein